MRHGIAHPGCRHGDGGDPSANANQHAGGEDPGAGGAKEHPAELGDKGGVRGDLIKGQNSQERSADQQIDNGDEGDSTHKRERQGALRIADFSSDLACLPPAAEAEERAHHAPGDRRKQCVRSGAADGKRQQVGHMRVARNNRPANQREQDKKFEAIHERHDCAALNRVPMRLMAPNRQSSNAGTADSPGCPGGSSWATYGAAPTASAAATPGYMTMELIQP